MVCAVAFRDFCDFFSHSPQSSLTVMAASFFLCVCEFIDGYFECILHSRVTTRLLSWHVFFFSRHSSCHFSFCSSCTTGYTSKKRSTMVERWVIYTFEKWWTCEGVLSFNIVFSLPLSLSFTQPSKKRRKVAPDALQARVDALQAVGGV